MELIRISEVIYLMKHSNEIYNTFWYGMLEWDGNVVFFFLSLPLSLYYFAHILPMVCSY